MSTQGRKAKRRDAWEIVLELLQILAKEKEGSMLLTRLGSKAGLPYVSVADYVKGEKYGSLFKLVKRGKNRWVVEITENGRAALAHLKGFQECLHC